MSAPIYRIPAKARALWRERGTSVHQLALASGLPVRTAQWALSSHPRSTMAERARLNRYLTVDERIELGWMTDNERFDVEHFRND